jgi:hypothetical protein
MGSKEKITYLLPKLVYIGTIIMFLMPIIPRGIRPVFIALFLIISITSAIIDREKIKWKYFFLNSSLFLIYLFSLLYTEDVFYGLRKLSTSVSLLIFPLIFASMSKRCLDYVLDRRHDLMWYFISATIILNIAAFIKFYLHYSFDDVLIHFVNIIRSDIYGWKINPIYLSMHICISMIFSLFLFQKGLNWQKLAVLIVINAFFVVFLMLLIKKGPLIALMLVTGFLAVMFKNKKLYLVFAVGVIGMIGVILFIPKVNARFSELLQVQHADESMTNSTNIRFSIYECVMKVIPEAGALGYGIGDGKNELINCYENNISFLADHKYNSHNQFMGIILKVGYVGLGLFTLFLLFHLVRAFERKNYLLISVLMFYCIVMFSENIIERENGVLYFSLFINLFLMLDYNYKSQSSANPVIENLSKN